MPENQIVVITGASSGFGWLAARELGRRGHIVFAGMRETAGRNRARVADLAAYAAETGLDIRAIEMDVQSQESVDRAIAEIIDTRGRLDVVIHNAGHMALGPTEAFTAEQLAELYDVNTLSTQRVNRAALPHLRTQRNGLVLWVGSTSTRGGHPPFLAPYFAAKAGMDALAESYAAELIKFGIETSIVVPGAYPSGTNHFAHAAMPADTETAGEYDSLYGELRERMGKGLSDIFPQGRTVDEVAETIAAVVDLPAGERPFRVHIDPSRDGSEVVSIVFDRIRSEFFHRIGIQELLGRHDTL